ncbi:MAG: hypothetical protein LBV77_01820 [Candidatus Adiutrix intracellularis]|nr:hypothetical protein [Candidatus Adiutrix intracellularis]
MSKLKVLIYLITLVMLILTMTYTITTIMTVAKEQHRETNLGETLNAETTAVPGNF